MRAGVGVRGGCAQSLGENWADSCGNARGVSLCGDVCRHILGNCTGIGKASTSVRWSCRGVYRSRGRGLVPDAARSRRSSLLFVLRRSSFCSSRCGFSLGVPIAFRGSYIDFDSSSRRRLARHPHWRTVGHPSAHVRIREHSAAGYHDCAQKSVVVADDQAAMPSVQRRVLV